MLASFKKTIHDVKGLLGANVTLDKEYDHDYRLFSNYEKNMKGLYKALSSYNDALTKLAQAQRKISKKLTKVFGETSDPSFTSYVNYNEGIANEIETHQKRFENQIKVDPLATIDNYMGQFQELHRRNDERNKRLYTYEKLSKETKETGIEPTSQKESFESINTELRNDYHAVYDDRINFINVLYPLIVSAQITFFSEVSQTMQTVAHIARSADGNKARAYPHAITANSTSSMYGRFVSAQLQQANYNPNSPTTPSFSHNNNNFQTPHDDYSPSAPPESTLNSYNSSYSQNQSSYSQKPSSFSQNQSSYSQTQSSFSQNPPAPLPRPNLGHSQSSSNFSQNNNPRSQRPLPKPSRTNPAPNRSGGISNKFRRGPAPVRGHSSGSPQARAKFDFNASESTELSFKKGDILNIYSQQGEWWQAELNGQRGEIPANYVALI